MGYELHIHRAGDWMGSSSAPISEAEWLGVADADPALVRDGSDIVRAADGTDVEIPAFTYARADGGEGCGFSLDPAEGRITVAGAYDAASRKKAVEVAERLGARVQGDDGELYDDEGEGFEVERPAPPRRGFLGRLRGR